MGGFLAEILYSLLYVVLLASSLASIASRRKAWLYSLAASTTGTIIVVILGLTGASFTVPIMHMPALVVSFNKLSAVFASVMALGSLLAILLIRDIADEHDYAAIMLSVLGLVGFFTSLDLFWMLVFWETTVLPLYYLAYRRGGRGSALLFLAYTQVAGILLAAATMLALHQVGSDALCYISQLTGSVKTLVTVLLVATFMIKASVFPFHFWLPRLYSENPAQVAMLSVLMVKMGVYGLALLRLYNVYSYSPVLVALSLTGALYALLIAHRHIGESGYVPSLAYLSIAHMNFIASVAFSASQPSLIANAVTLYSVAHTLSLIPALAYAYLSSIGADERMLLAASSTLLLPLPGLVLFSSELLALAALLGTATWAIILGALISLLNISAASWLLYRALSEATIHGMKWGHLVAGLAIASITTIALGVVPVVIEPFA